MLELDDRRLSPPPVEQDRKADTCRAQLTTVTRCTPPQLTPSPDHQLGDEVGIRRIRPQILAPSSQDVRIQHDHQSHGHPQNPIDAPDCLHISQGNNKPGLEHSSPTVPPDSHSVDYLLSSLPAQDNSRRSLNTVVIPSSREREAWRRLPKARSTMSGTVKRSASTPNVQQAAVAAAAAAVALGDKRRNKLGYHRTSVACGHCRRRKIRCLLAKDDSQSRCSNCIRLKKECNFFPVNNTEGRQRSLSKPDISSKDEASSSTSSPSPGLALGKLPPAELSNPIHAASVPATPTFDFPAGVLDGSLRHNSISSATSIASGRTSISHSTATSRRPSLAHLISGLKTEGDYMNPCLVRYPGYEISPFSDASPGQGDQFGLESAFWRLASSPMTQAPYPGLSHHLNLGSMTSVNSAEASDVPDERLWTSRMNSIDYEIVPGFPLPSTYSSDAEFSGIPDTYSTSASASTASLTASISETSTLGDSRLPSQMYLHTWVNPSPLSPQFPAEKVIINDQLDYYPIDDGYGQMQGIDDPSIAFPSPLQSPKFVSHVG